MDRPEIRSQSTLGQEDLCELRDPATKPDFRSRLVLTLFPIRQLDTVVSLALVPLNLFASLQELALLGAWPRLPYASYLRILPALTPLFPQKWTLRSSLAYGRALVLSPLVLLPLLTLSSEFLRPKLTQYCQTLLPRPDCPDQLSMKCAELAQDSVVLSHSRRQGGFLDQLSKDYAAVREMITNMRLTMRSYGENVSAFFRTLGPWRQQPDEEALEPLTTTSPSPEIISSEELGQGPFDAFFERSVQFSQPARSASSSPSVASPPGSPIPEPGVQIRTRTGSSNTLHMDVEVNTFNRAEEAQTVSGSFSTSQRPTILDGDISQAATAGTRPVPEELVRLS
jgi:hypothetical protein